MNHNINKRPKDMKLCQMIRRTININRKELGFEWDDVAAELGMSGSTLDNKLKPAKIDNDITLSEFIHILELTGDMSALEHLNSLCEYIAIPKKVSVPDTKDITILVSMAMKENNDVFNEAQKDLADGKIDAKEKASILKELEEAQKANANLRYIIERLKV